MKWLALVLVLSGQAASADIVGATYDLPTDVYGHGVVPGGEYAGITFRLSPDRVIGAGTFENVYEDTAPRLVDLDGDGSAEVITVVSYFDRGAAIRIWDEIPAPDAPGETTVAVIAEGEPIGTRFRWLAIIGAADLDGDGTMEIAYIDRPHLANTLRIVTIQGDQLAEEIAGAGFTNHRIGERDIAGGVRDCGAGPEMIVASADWAQLVAVTYDGTALDARQIGTDTSRPAFAKAMACQ